jgi:hypothetical protein
MPKIIQFLHTAQEATPVNELDNVIPWNNNDTHRRKFILSNGKFVNDNVEQEESELVFWGEWEAQSEIVRINNGNTNPPNYLNRPFINPAVPNRTHNTDPYVFGDKFRYIICKQGYFHNVLTNLEPNSIILFGSSINGQFCLDTVFVVSNDKSNYTVNTIENLFPLSTRGQYYHASVNPIYDEFEYNRNAQSEDFCRINDQRDYTFYKAVNFLERQNYNGLYSYVPCQVYNLQNYIFRQPAITLDFINGNQTQGINSKDCNENEIVNYWNDIAHQIQNKNLRQGTYFKTPELRTN